MNALMIEAMNSRRRARNPRVWAALKALDLPVETTVLLGIDYVAVNHDIFQPANDGSAAITFPYFSSEEGNELVDIVAIGLHSRRSATRYGRAQILDTHWIESAFIHDRPVPVYLDGLRWLHSGCRGVFIIDLEVASYALGEASGIACSDEVTARRLHDALNRPPRVPAIYTPEARHAA